MQERFPQSRSCRGKNRHQDGGGASRRRLHPNNPGKKLGEIWNLQIVTGNRFKMAAPRKIVYSGCAQKQFPVMRRLLHAIWPRKKLEHPVKRRRPARRALFGVGSLTIGNYLFSLNRNSSSYWLLWIHLIEDMNQVFISCSYWAKLVVKASLKKFK